MKLFYTLTFIFLIGNFSAIAQKVQNGVASFYADKFNGRLTANGERFSNNAMTAAHLTLPFNTMVKVTNKANNKSVVLRINDRGPYVKGRIIDLSKKAAKLLDYVDVGLANVKVEVLKSDEKKDELSQNPSNPNPFVPKQSEYYEVSTEKSSPNGFGIQVGSYQELVNMLREVNTLEQQTSDKVFIEVGKFKTKKVYRISVGAFKERPVAERRLRLLKKKYPDSFIVSYKSSL